MSIGWIWSNSSKTFLLQCKLCCHNKEGKNMETHISPEEGKWFGISSVIFFSANTSFFFLSTWLNVTHQQHDHVTDCEMGEKELIF